MTETAKVRVTMPTIGRSTINSNSISTNSSIRLGSRNNVRVS
jgi:hypothetical protein